MEYGKVQQKINDVVGDNVKKLEQLFPAAVKDGEVDFEALLFDIQSASFFVIRLCLLHGRLAV